MQVKMPTPPSPSPQAPRPAPMNYQRFKQLFQSKSVLLVLFVVAFAGLGTYALFQAKADSNKAPAKPISAESLFLEPSTAKVANNTTFTLNVWEDSLTQKVNAVQADLSYPTDKLEFVNIDAQDSAFDVQAPSTGGNGTISIARGSTKGVIGRQLVAKVTLKAKASNGKVAVNVAASTVLVRSSDNTNILRQAVGGTYMLQP